jgi:sugar phosphate isomerase/epimerase
VADLRIPRVTPARQILNLRVMNSSSLTRRRFLHTMAAAGAGAALGARADAASAAKSAASGSRFPIITFSKPFQNVGYDRSAEIVQEVGWNGIECPVRAKGQVEPEKVEDELPKLNEALTKRGLTLSLVTTNVIKPDALSERVLRTAAKLGVKRYRLDFVKYDLTKPIPPQLAALKPQLKELAALNRQLGIKGGLQNHSGKDMIGAPVWDIYELIHDIDPEYLGTCFDIGHATLEGGLSWPIEAKLMEPFFTCVYVKDFHWEKGPKGWVSKWGPLGEGMVHKEFFDWLKKTSYDGPISQHCEYLTDGSPASVDAMKKDCALLKQWLA